MARPTQTRINRDAGFAPAVGRAPGLVVAAPINVQAAPTGGELLANALGVALQGVTPFVEQRLTENARDATALGRQAGIDGTVDEKRQAEDANYAFGVKRALVDSAIVQFKSMAVAFYENEFDKTKGTEVLAGELDRIAKGALGQYAGDPDAALWMTPEVEGTLAKITGVHDAALAEEFKTERVASASAILRDKFNNQEGIDPEEIMGRLRPILGNSAATKEYVKMVGSLAVENSDEAIIDALIPEKWADGTPGPRSIPDLNSDINQFRYYARAAARGREEELSEVSEAEYDRLILKASMTAHTGVEPWDVFKEMTEKGLIPKDSDFRAVMGFARSSQEDARDRQYDPNALASFRIHMMENAKTMTPADLANFVRDNIPPGRDGFAQANMIADDFRVAYEAAREIENNPLAKTYKSNLSQRYKPETWATPQEKDNFFNGMVAFDKEMLASGDAEKARAAAEQYFGKIAGPEQKVQPSNDVRSDVRAFIDNKLPSAAFKQKYAGRAEEIYRGIGNGYSREEAKRAVELLLAP
jgi:hypothetical protein